MGGGSVQDTKLVVAGANLPGSTPFEDQGFYSLNGTDFTEINEPSFNQEAFAYRGIGYNTTTDNEEPKWAVVGNGTSFPFDVSYAGFYSNDGINWNIIEDASYFLGTSNSFKSIASDASKNWVAVGNNLISSNPISITTSSIDTSNSWTSFDLFSISGDLNIYTSVDYFNNYWICVGQTREGFGADFGGVWASSTKDPTDSWNFINDMSFSQYIYEGVGHDITGRWMVVGYDNSGNSKGKAFYSASASNPVDSSWTAIVHPSVDISNTIWNDTDYSPVDDRWVIVGQKDGNARIVYNDSGDLSNWNVADISDPDLSGFQIAWSVVWDKTFNKFYCVGQRLNTSLETYGVIADSSNGVVWQKTESNSTYDASQNIFYAIGTSNPNQ